MDIITIAIIAYLVNGVGIWCFGCQVNPTDLRVRRLAPMLCHVFLWPLILLMAAFITIADVW